jgi:choline dehydrogenase-like flavoprotein
MWQDRTSEAHRNRASARGAEGAGRWLLLQAPRTHDSATRRERTGRSSGRAPQPGGSLQSRQQPIEWLRATAEHLYHPVGSCRIGPPDDGVVDPELRVYGIEGLRVADASLMPRITSGNTNAPTYMIAERCAALMLRETQPTSSARQAVAAT